ncbi:dihydrodipicolinate reductase 3, chloroplastic-like [Dorcoceras hygrometricum]|uniref:Dihydrodipicolinate reductase 3, chloroplastic-like n=1 Tax=Dorcoceras hygrometricum TaxID=472368 RepID=A0A2Z7BQ50_9LAMI|nr:dihydrodipicolinate reductase 3, chloroplastic-like [Dorcoceras hygrometricum]
MMNYQAQILNPSILHKKPHICAKTTHFPTNPDPKLHRPSPLTAHNAVNQQQTVSPVAVNDTEMSRIDVINVKLKTLEDCKLGISRYPDFQYDARGGSGSGRGTPVSDNSSDDPLNVNGEVYVEFDVSKLYIPAVSTATTKFLGLPLPPFVKIAVVPEMLSGKINQDSGQVDLNLKAKFFFSMGSIYRAAPLAVDTVLTSEEATGDIRRGSGVRLNKQGLCTLVGVARVERIGDFFMDSFLSLPSECLACLRATISFHPKIKTFNPKNVNIFPYVSCSMQPTQTNIKVIVNGAAKEIGRAAVVAITKARGMEVAGAVDSHFIGEDVGKICNMEDALEIPIMNDITMVLGSISQSKAPAVVVDFTDPSTVYDNVKQKATAFGMKSVVYVPRIKMETISALSDFCEKASMGCLVAPTLSIGSILLQQAAISASFHYNNVEIVESRSNPGDFPSQDAMQIANNITNLGHVYNREDISTDIKARGEVVGEDGVRVHSLVLPGLPSSTSVNFSRPGEVYTIKHDIVDVQCLMPGLILAIRKVVRLKVISRNSSIDYSKTLFSALLAMH